MMTNRYRMHRWRSLRCWAIVGALCIVVYAGCADSAGTVPGHTTLAIENLRVDSITEDLVTVAFSINEPATIFWKLYAHNAPPPDDINAVMSDAHLPSPDPMIVRNGTQIEKRDDGTHTIQLANLPSGHSYNLYVAAANTHGSSVLADSLPITTIRNISGVGITRIRSEAIQINWTNPSAQENRVLEKIVIDWSAISHNGESATSGSYNATDILAADAKTQAVLPIISTRFSDYRLSLTARYRDGGRLPSVTTNYRTVIDDDGDGLIDINTLEDLNNIRCNPEGTAYQTVAPDGVTCSEFSIRCGVDGATECIGYELRRDLDFSKGTSYATGRVNRSWQPNSASDSRGWVTTANRGKNKGWLPIESITTTFEGNDHTIENLYVRDITRQDDRRSGLFGRVSGRAASIKNVTLKSALVYGGSGHYSHVGALAGELNGGIIEDVGIIGGRIDGVGGNYNRIGGLVGQNADKGVVRNSYATATVHGSPGWQNLVGGLVGRNNDSTITASYATGDAYGGDDSFDCVGGLVGEVEKSWPNVSMVIASYATGNADGGGGHYDKVGGLVGCHFSSAIVASYATGYADGDWGVDFVGGLVGHSAFGTIIASYATGNVYGGGDRADSVGGLVGQSEGSGVIAVSYATGNTSNGGAGANALIGDTERISRGNLIIKDSYGFGNGSKTHNSPLPPGASRANHLTAPVANNPPNTAVPHVWDNAAAHSKGAWDFGTSVQRPALRYAEYNGSGGAYSCDQFPAPCGTLIPGQRWED